MGSVNICGFRGFENGELFGKISLYKKRQLQLSGKKVLGLKIMAGTLKVLTR